MPPKGIVLPLNDRPAIRSAVGEFRLPNKRLSTAKSSFQVLATSFQHLVPIRFTWQGACDHRVPYFQRLRLSFDPVFCCLCISPGLVQPEERRTRPRQRRIQGCLRGTGGRKKTLDLSKGGMLGKDYTFEVVLDPARDPGADKPRPMFRLLRSGQVFSQREDTGGACSKAALGNRSPKSAGIGAARLL